MQTFIVVFGVLIFFAIILTITNYIDRNKKYD